MSNFELDADSPFEKPSEAELKARPEPLKYPQNHPKYRFYGNNIKIMIDVAVSWEDSELKEALVYTIANHMKKCFLNWNRDTVKDSVIFKHLEELSNGKIVIKTDDETLSEASELVKYNSNKRRHNNKKSYKNKSRKRVRK